MLIFKRCCKSVRHGSQADCWCGIWCVNSAPLQFIIMCKFMQDQSSNQLYSPFISLKLSWFTLVLIQRSGHYKMIVWRFTATMLSWWKVTKPLQSQPVIKVFLTYFIGVSQWRRTFQEEFNQNRYLDYLLQHPVLSIRSRTESGILLYTVKDFHHIYQKQYSLLSLPRSH